MTAEVPSETKNDLPFATSMGMLKYCLGEGKPFSVGTMTAKDIRAFVVQVNGGEFIYDDALKAHRVKFLDRDWLYTKRHDHDAAGKPVFPAKRVFEPVTTA